MTNFYRSVFPLPLVLPEHEALLLRRLFPTVDWQKTRIYDGLPWFASRSFAIAMALPATLHRSRAHIHFRDYQKSDSFFRIGTLVHEAFHIQQYKDLENPWADFGYCRRFLRWYVAWYFAGLWKHWRATRSWSQANQLAYRQHPMEIPAYDFEHQFMQHYNWYQRLDVDDFIENFPELIRKNAGKIERPPFWAWLLGAGITFIIAFTKPILDLFFVMIASIKKKIGR